MAERDDLAALPLPVQARARIYDNGEISWPTEDAERAINSLADAGFVILGLDVRRHDDQGHTWETPWSDFSRTDDYRNGTGDEAERVENSPLHALQALAREDTPEFGDWILISWSLAPNGPDAPQGSQSAYRPTTGLPDPKIWPCALRHRTGRCRPTGRQPDAN
jgi:hypothetical protein